MENKYKWNYSRVGGVTRVSIKSGEDIAHLGELNQEKWTVLSCPVNGLRFDRRTLELLDSDSDGKIRVDEVVSAAKWITAVIKDKDLILKGSDELPIDQIDDTTPAGKQLKESAIQILKNLGLEKNSISINDTSDSVAIFAKTLFNGDGVIIPASAGEENLAKVIEACVAATGGTADRSGIQGVTAEQIDAFYASLADYSAWCAAAEADKKAILPYGDNTEAALAACTAVKDKVADYFMRCKLIGFDEGVADAVDVNADKVAAISDKNLSLCAEEIASYPLARPGKEGKLSYDAINPAWQAAFASVKTLVLDVALPGKKEITEADWNGVLGSFAAYEAWKASKKGESVEALGLDCVNAFLKADDHQALLDLVAQDKALESESASIDEVDKLLHYYRHFYHFLNNYVVFSDFYGRNESLKAVFEAGKLYIDERCCNLCINVDGPGNHAEAASLSGMFLIYCTCTSKKLGKTQNIVAVMTDGSIKNLRPGKNAIFYDLDGNDWDAVVTKIVDNPISIKQAFWSPYRKLGKFITDKIEKSAAEKDAKATSSLIAGAEKPAEKKTPFDIAKFAGIFAALGMGLGMIGGALVSVANGIKNNPTNSGILNLIIVLVAVALVISGPACFLAWLKLRKRNLGPVLNANGWAINSMVLVNILFGGTLTSVAKYPVVKAKDPFQKKTPFWKKFVCVLVILCGVGAALYFTDHLGFVGVHRNVSEPAATECVQEAPAAAEGAVAPVDSTLVAQ